MQMEEVCFSRFRIKQKPFNKRDNVEIMPVDYRRI